MILMFTGYSRSASKILKDQDSRSRRDDSEMLENLHFVKDLGLRSYQALEEGRLEEFADLMNSH
jgi:D-glycero-alpha-D-manno-heptose-7-phosphate kinase